VSRTSTGSSSRRSPGPVSEFGIPYRPEEIRRTLRELGVRPTRSRGQSFLADPFVADAEAALVEVEPGTAVVEIGGGLGILTEALLRRGVGPLTVIERDPRLAAHLRDTFGSRARVEEADALAWEFDGVSCAVGNLPYSIATPLLLRCFASRVPRVVFLLQREVAERLAAGPGSRQYGRLSIVARLYGEVELFRPVSRESFEPTPEVESRLGTHVARRGPLPVPSVPVFEAAVRELFGSRRKQLGNLLPRVAGSRPAADRLALRAGWPTGWERERPEDLPPEAFFRLATALDRADPQR
jgi:16S rRNA (adenine1518-N6/adenine1519-N6)-dimethyltransferase